jgi:multidrug resistance efflux pump
MNDKERLQEIASYWIVEVNSKVCSGWLKNPCEISPSILIELGKLIEQAQKVEQLEQEVTRYHDINQGLLEVQFDLRQEIKHLKDWCEIMKQQLQQAQTKVKHLENTIKETLDTLKRGGPGTRSQVQSLLENALEGE